MDDYTDIAVDYCQNCGYDSASCICEGDYGRCDECGAKLAEDKFDDECDCWDY